MLLKLGPLLLVAPLILLMGAWGVEYGEVSSCIHQGGSFDYLLGECLMDQTGIFVPFAERYPLLVSISLWASCAGLIFSLVGLYKGRT